MVIQSEEAAERAVKRGRHGRRKGDGAGAPANRAWAGLAAGRIFARLREGWAYDEIASQERLTAERVRQIVRQALEKRVIDEGAEHAKLQLARLQPAMRLAGEAIADGDVKAIAPLMKVLDRLDRYQRAAKAIQVYDDEARRKLMDKINRVAANLGVDEDRNAAKAAEAAIAAPAGGEAAALAGARAETGSGVGASP
jgi:hypothetical protein